MVREIFRRTVIEKKKKKKPHPMFWDLSQHKKSWARLRCGSSPGGGEKRGTWPARSYLAALFKKKRMPLSPFPIHREKAPSVPKKKPRSIFGQALRERAKSFSLPAAKGELPLSNSLGEEVLFEYNREKGKRSGHRGREVISPSEREGTALLQFSASSGVWQREKRLYSEALPCYRKKGGNRRCPSWA